jgi:cytidylate kinase
MRFWGYLVGKQPTLDISVIAIDGPVASGKSVVGLALAQHLGFNYLDSGLMYRAVTWLALREDVDMEDESAVACLAENNPIKVLDRDGVAVEIGGHRLGPELREPRIDQRVSQIAKISPVRQVLVHQQRMLASEVKIVMVGRDIGTVVLPDADLKVFLLASPDRRARRRWQEWLDQGVERDYGQVLQDTEARDQIDSRRADSPLTPAEGVFLVDTEDMAVDQVVDVILKRLNLTSRGCPE